MQNICIMNPMKRKDITFIVILKEKKSIVQKAFSFNLWYNILNSAIYIRETIIHFIPCNDGHYFNVLLQPIIMYAVQSQYFLAVFHHNDLSVSKAKHKWHTLKMASF